MSLYSGWCQHGVPYAACSACKLAAREQRAGLAPRDIAHRQREACAEAAAQWAHASGYSYGEQWLLLETVRAVPLVTEAEGGGSPRGPELDDVIRRGVRD